MNELTNLMSSDGDLTALGDLWSWACVNALTWLALWILIHVVPVILPLELTDTQAFTRLKHFLESKVVQAVMTVFAGTLIWFVL
ncbi:hypothetical protein [Gordonia sihwensis]|uniref:hypothetical protein n=1 Tax=Gordonia sihwensis TaxID=173559 RepID=UPI0005EFFAB2|nr:hypothetical protein [Gordonia sihwensis]KJR05919.1 hypothetical protein UG54_15175 [Gordonia sihwensis]